MDGKTRFSETRRLIVLLKSIGTRKEFPVPVNLADTLSYYLMSKNVLPSEVQPAVIKLIEELPSALRSAGGRARTEKKKEIYETYAVVVETGFPKLLEAWRYWDKTKAKLDSMKNDLLHSYLIVNSLHGYYLEESSPKAKNSMSPLFFMGIPNWEPGSREQAISSAFDELFILKVVPASKLQLLSEEFYSLAATYAMIEVRPDDLDSKAKAVAVLREGAEELSLMAFLEENWNTTT